MHRFGEVKPVVSDVGLLIELSNDMSYFSKSLKETVGATGMFCKNIITALMCLGVGTVDG